MFCIIKPDEGIALCTLFARSDISVELHHSQLAYWDGHINTARFDLRAENAIILNVFIYANFACGMPPLQSLFKIKVLCKVFAGKICYNDICDPVLHSSFTIVSLLIILNFLDHYLPLVHC